MTCEDCLHARANSAHRRYDLNCLYCGARYAMIVRSSQTLQLPADVAGKQMSRREWFDHVMKTWTDWGHDAKKLRDLAAGAAVPFDPMEKKSEADNSTANGKPAKRAGTLAGKGSARAQGAACGGMDAGEQSGSRAAVRGDDDAAGANERSG